MEPEEIRARIAAAEARRRPIAGALGVDAYRVLNGPGDGAPPGLTLDRYARWLVLAARDALPPDVVGTWADAALAVLDGDGLVVKTLCRQVTRSRSAVVAGALPDAPVRVRERDAVLLCDLDDGTSTGLFLDHRETRFAIRAHAQDVEVLNLFAYTGAFSVHAALGGARRVTSVDVGRRALSRGRENMSASGLDPDRHRWFADDVLEHLRRQARRGQAYGLIIADPPVLGRAGRSTFSLERHLGALVHGCLDSLVPGGVLALSTHAVGLGEGGLLGAVQDAAASAHRPLEVLATLGLPAWDHPVGVAPEEGASDRGDYLKTLVLRAG